jgi:hypothetical protein
MSSYHIYASLHEGRPSLQIVDADSQHTCLDWEISPDQQRDEKHAEDIHALFRKLLLLTCRQKLQERIKRQQNDEGAQSD